MSPVEHYIQSQKGNQRIIMQTLHEILVHQFELTDKIRFKIPFYYQNTWVCYLNKIKGDKIELSFINGKKLSNIQGLLNDKGRKMVSGIEFNDPSNIPLDEVYEIISEALILDEENKKS